MVLTSLKCNGGRCPFGLDCSVGLRTSLVKSVENGVRDLGEYNKCFDVISDSLFPFPLLSSEKEAEFDELE